MLDKLKLFKNDKSDRSSTKTQTSKRTSSSSGFSSARSERSDSSISLNEQHQPSPQQTQQILNHQTHQQSRSKKSELSIPVAAKSKSKLLGSTKSISSIRDSTVSLKEKTPSRIETPIEAKIPAPKVQKVPTRQEPPIPKPTSLGRKLETRSESRNSLSSHIQPPKTMISVPGAVGTGIPKPTAFIKGTTKPPTPLTQTKTVDPIKQDPKYDDHNTPSRNISNSNQDVARVPAHNQEHLQNIQNEQNHNCLHNQSISSGLSNHTNSISMSDSSNSKSHSSSPGLHSNSSDSSVIYRPSSESGSDALHLKGIPMMSPSGHNKVDIGSNRNLAQMMDHHHHQQPPNNSPHHRSHSSVVVSTTAGTPKFNTVPSKLMNGVIFEEEKQMTVMPMRPLLRGYNSHVTLPTRGTRGQHLVQEYCDDMAQGGYCSDGDALRKASGPGVRYTDIENGYMSEGDGGVHGRQVLSMMRSRTQLPTTIEER